MSEKEIGLDYLFHPGAGFSHPSEVISDEDLTINEKRSILAAWASDACSIENSPRLRRGAANNVPFEEIIEALRTLDEQSRSQLAVHRALRKRRVSERHKGRPPESNFPG